VLDVCWCEVGLFGAVVGGCVMGGGGVVGLWKVGSWKSDFPFAGWGWFGIVYVWGVCGLEGVSLLERCTGLVMVINSRFMFISMIL